MNPSDPNEPLPTTPVDPAAAPPPAEAPPPAAPPAAAPPGPQWGAPPPPPGWGPPSWGPPPPAVPPPPPPRRDRLALAVVTLIFGGLFVVFFGFLLLAYSVVKGESPRLGGGPRIGVVEVKGVIGGGPGDAEAEPIMKNIRRFAADDGIKAVIVRIDSPGGAVSPSQEIHDELLRLGEKKTVVCSMGNVAASGGFYVAMGCDRIVAEPGTLTGSIGVISQFVSVKGLIERFDVRTETIKSGKLKDMGSPLRDMTPEDRAYWQSVTDSIFEQFLRAVVEARELPEERVRAVADGRVLTGEDAQRLGLIDDLGNFWDAVELARQDADLQGEPVLVYPPEDGARFLEQLMGGAARSAARAVQAEVARGAASIERPGLYYLAR